jgi:hypothetical protein
MERVIKNEFTNIFKEFNDVIKANCDVKSELKENEGKTDGL